MQVVGESEEKSVRMEFELTDEEVDMMNDMFYKKYTESDRRLAIAKFMLYELINEIATKDLDEIKMGKISG